MAVCTAAAVFPCGVHKVWESVTNIDGYAWRSDLGRVERLDETHFVEYTKEGYSTHFTVTVSEPFRRWEMDMDNSNMSGHWAGDFTEENGGTAVTFTENVTAKKLWMRPFVKIYLKKQQARFIADLAEELAK